jgi:hypothetical protein
MAQELKQGSQEESYEDRLNMVSVDCPCFHIAVARVPVNVFFKLSVMIGDDDTFVSEQTNMWCPVTDSL